MKKFVYTLLFMLLVFGMEAATLAGDIKVKRCETCGQIVSLCRYNGNHPKCQTCGKIVDNCPYKGNHPKCQTCGKIVDKCRYKGSHPKCKTCGKTVDQCSYKGSHPKCKTCGKLVEQCRYKGSHPKCKTCGKLLENCPYGGEHPAPSFDVSFTCNASGATLFVDGKKIGPANRSYSLKTGDHTVELVADGYETKKASIRVNKATSYNYNMEQIEHDVLISCDVDATITVDGKRLDNPVGKIKMKDGKHLVKIVSNGYNDITTEILVDKDHTSFQFDMVPKESITRIIRTLSEHKSPSQSPLTISDNYLGNTSIVDYTSIGLSYDYSEHFPIGFGLNFTFSHLTLGVDVGIDTDKKLYTFDKKTVNPMLYMTISPGIYCKFFSVYCGFGVLNYKIVSEYFTSTETMNGDGYSYTGSTSKTTDELGGVFCLKPTVVGYIPIKGGKRFIKLKVGYHYIPKIKELNGLTFGVGFQWVLPDF